MIISGGKRVRSGKIGKIFGLDPAFPLFSMDKPDERLDASDATYVETIHTSRLGFFQPIGMVNFYPNGGKSQPDCRRWNIVRSYRTKVTIWLETNNGLFSKMCQHRAAYMYFAQSVASEEPLVGHLCDTLDDIKTKNCTGKGLALGGEPGAKKQYVETSFLTICWKKSVIDLIISFT